MNNAALRFNVMAVEAMRADPGLNNLTKDYRSPKGGPILYPYLFLQEDQRFTETLESWEKTLPSSDNDISVETQGPGWSRVEMKIPGSEFFRDPALAKRALERIRAGVRETDLAREYINEKSDLHRALDNLQKDLSALTGSSNTK